MRLVERPYAKPMRCAANPSIGQTRRDVRWIDTGSEMDGFDNHIYLSEPSVRDAAKLLGFPSQGEYEALLEQHDRLQFEVRQLKADLADATETLRAISTVQAAGLTVTKE